MVRALGLVIVLSQAALGQSLAKVPEFEVADVKVSNGMRDAGKIQFLPGGRIDLPNVTVKSLILVAYDLQEDTITGGPGWIDSDHFDIVAKAPPDTPRDKIRLMLRALLAERFKLAIHREDKPMPVYAMVVGKDGPKLQKAAGGPSQCSWNNPGSGLIQRQCHNMTMEELAASMPRWGMANRIDLPVVDLTGIKGAYDFQLEWSVPAGGDASKGDAPVAGEPGGSTIFDALGQIGLKLEQRKRPMSVVVIDRVERIPIAN
jgi:uncharacterized protein (TIGR03435 family)